MEFYITIAIVIAIIIFVVIPILLSAIKVVKEYERGVVLRLGRFLRVAEPGLNIIIPMIDKMIKVDMRVTTREIPAQEVITKDNVSIKVDAIIYYRVVDPEAAVLNVENYDIAVFNLAQTTLRSVLGEVELDDVLARREELSAKIREIIDRKTEDWGVHVTDVEIRDVILPESMVKAMARQAEAERNRRARIIEAEAEKQAAKTLKEAAEILGMSPAMLRVIQALKEIKAKTVLFPLPLDLMDLLGSVASEEDEE